MRVGFSKWRPETLTELGHLFQVGGSKSELVYRARHLRCASTSPRRQYPLRKSAQPAQPSRVSARPLLPSQPDATKSKSTDSSEWYPSPPISARHLAALSLQALAHKLQFGVLAVLDTSRHFLFWYLHDKNQNKNNNKNHNCAWALGNGIDHCNCKKMLERFARSGLHLRVLWMHVHCFLDEDKNQTGAHQPLDAPKLLVQTWYGQREQVQ